MVSHMKTTLDLDDRLLLRLKTTAARQRTTLTALVETALRRFLAPRRTRERALPRLPTFDGGGCSVDVADREALDAVMNEP
jgi:predicted transcriptional regulator